MSRLIKLRYVYQHEDTGVINSEDLLLEEVEEGLVYKTKQNYRRYQIIARLPFTGLKDKNGVEIYEGDVLKVYIYDALIEIPDDNNSDFYIGEITYGKTRLLIAGEEFEDYDIDLSEVIGNKYKNKDLLHKTE